MLAFLFVATLAHADDAKTYPGQMCRSSSNSTAAVTADGGFLNNGYPTLNFHCPIIKDEPDSTLDVVDSHMWITDQTTYGAVNCTLFSRLWIYGGLYQTTATSSYVGVTNAAAFSAAQPVKLTFAGDSWSWPSTEASSINFLSCDVPGIYYSQSGINSYLIDENN